MTKHRGEGSVRLTFTFEVTCVRRLHLAHVKPESEPASAQVRTQIALDADPGVFESAGLLGQAPRQA